MRLRVDRIAASGVPASFSAQAGQQGRRCSSVNANRPAGQAGRIGQFGPRANGHMWGRIVIPDPYRPLPWINGRSAGPLKQARSPLSRHPKGPSDLFARAWTAGPSGVSVLLAICWRGLALSADLAQDGACGAGAWRAYGGHRVIALLLLGRDGRMAGYALLVLSGSPCRSGG